MSRLRELQRDFQAAVTGAPSGVLERVAQSREVPAAARVRVYADAVRLRFLDALHEDYPGLFGLLGQQDFETLGRAYVAARPSRHRSMRWFGGGLPAFVAATPPWDERPALAEMAAFEWAKGELNDAADSPVAGVDDVALVPPARWGELRPRPVPALRRLDLEWNVPPVWRALDRGEAPPRLVRAPRSVAWLLWRRDLELVWRSLLADEAAAFDACRRGADFERLCFDLAARVGETAAPLRAATCLKQWLMDGLIADVGVPG